MIKEIKITIPEFVQEMKLSESRRKLYWKPEDVESGALPGRFIKKGTENVLALGYKFKKGKLYDEGKRDFVVRNAAFAGKPRMKAIAGNDIWARVHQRVRMAMIDTIEKDMEQHLPQRIDLKFPIQIDMDVYTPPRYCDWDVGNLWVYDKVFQDMLVRKKLIPDDSILYVTKSSGPRFIPIVKHSERKLVFTLREEDDPNVLSHVMYDLHRKKRPTFGYDGTVTTDHETFLIQMSTNGEPGSIFVNHDSQMIVISVGKKAVHSKVKKGFARAFSTIVQMNAHVVVSTYIMENYGAFVQSEFVDRGLTVFVYAGGDEVQE